MSQPTTLAIRPATATDHDAVWEIFQHVISTGDTYVFDPGMERGDALTYWFRGDTHTYVAEHDGKVIGTYILKPNQPGLGSHIANGSYMVSQEARGLGAGRAMGVHSITEARRLGFRGMQFNIVIATNGAAVKLWQSLGFRIIGTLPGVFRHSQHGYTDAYVMFLPLVEE